MNVVFLPEVILLESQLQSSVLVLHLIGSRFYVGIETGGPIEWKVTTARFYILI